MERLGVDLDGVVCGFDKPYANLLQEEGVEIDPSTPDFPAVWDFDYMATKEQLNRVWDKIKNPDTRFWSGLPVYDETVEEALYLLNLRVLKGEIDLFFISSRPRQGSAKLQTERWLLNHGVAYPTVILTSEKGLVARALGLTHFIDDRPENIYDVRHHSPKTKVFLKTAGYNNSLIDSSLARVSGLNDLIQREWKIKVAA